MKGLIDYVNKKRELEKKLSSGGLPEGERRKIASAYSKILPVAERAERILRIEKEIEETKELLNDPEMRELAVEEIEKLEEEKNRLLLEIKRMILASSMDLDKNAIIEIRAGAGGEEAALFAADLYRMYIRYAEKKGWKYSVMDSHPTDMGGFKEIIFSIEGKSPYKYLHLESGVHRVQRVPITESGGRIHTSTASVVVLPEAEEADEIVINPDDIKIDTFRAGGPGGQYVNMTDSAVRITHIPTGIVVVCREERSQHKNREKAMKLLKARLKDLKEREERKKVDEQRKSVIGTGDRSEKIRTYNFPQNRVTDHRIGLTVYKLSEIMEGNLDEIIIPLLEEEERRRLKSLKIV